MRAPLNLILDCQGCLAQASYDLHRLLCRASEVEHCLRLIKLQVDADNRRPLQISKKSNSVTRTFAH